MLGVGVIGCGRIALRYHLPLLARLPGVRLVALAEPDATHRALAQRQAPRAVALERYDQLLALPDVQAVVICTPSGLHAEGAAAAFERGMHVYVEKPLATTMVDAERVLRAWRAAGTVGMIGFNLRFDRLTLATRGLIRAGRLGELAAARTIFCEPSRRLPEWQLTRRTGGGTLLDLGSHHADLAHFLFDHEVRAVWARQRSARAEGDTAVLELELANGLLVQSLLSQSAPMAHQLEVHGRVGALRLDWYRSLAPEVEALDRRMMRLRHAWSGVQSLARSPFLLGRALGLEGEARFRAALQHFVAAVHAGRPASPDLLDGARSLAVILAAEESIATGRRVELP